MRIRTAFLNTLMALILLACSPLPEPVPPRVYTPAEKKLLPLLGEWRFLVIISEEEKMVMRLDFSFPRLQVAREPTPLLKRFMPGLPSGPLPLLQGEATEDGRIVEDVSVLDTDGR